MRLGPKVRWDITMVCNLDCIHCQVGDIRRAGVEHPPGELLESVSRNLIGGGVGQIGLLGGEPFLHPDIISVLDIFINGGMPVTISTNGLSIPPDLIPLLGETSGWSIMVSLDGPDIKTHEMIRGAGTFFRTIKKIKTLVRATDKCDAVIGISCTLTLQTIGRMQEMRELAQQLGVSLLQFGSVKEVGNARIYRNKLHIPSDMLISSLVRFINSVPEDERSKQPEVIFDFLNKPLASFLQDRCDTDGLEIPEVECGGAESTAYVDSEGNLWPCVAVEEGYRKKNLDYSGSLNNSLIENDFRNIWYGELFRNFREIKNARMHITKGIPCRKCQFVDTCTPCPLPFWNNDYGYYDLCQTALNLAND